MQRDTSLPYTLQIIPIMRNQLAPLHTWPGLLIASTCAALLTTTALSQVKSYTMFGTSVGDELGYSVRGAGDVDGDGHDDIILGAPHNGVTAGSARVVSGASGGVLYSFVGESTGDFFGAAVSGAGDVNGDGFDDLIVGARWNSFGSSRAGSAHVFSGLDGTVIYVLRGALPGDEFGTSVGCAGDVDGDGRSDIIIGAPGSDINGFSSGSAYVHSGATGALLHRFDGSSTLEFFGHSVDGAGDIDGDGRADLIVGAPAFPTSRGFARVFSGSDGIVLHELDPQLIALSFGTSVSGAGDVDGDGIDDLIVGAPNSTFAGSAGSGAASVYSGADGALLHNLARPFGTVSFGMSVSGAGDVNGDGFGEVIVGGVAGSVRVFSGTDGGVLYTFLASSTGTQFGFSVSGAGDIDGDGLDDLVIGESNDHISGAGSAHVWTGTFSQGSPIGDNFCWSARNSTSVGGHIFATGSDVVSDNALTLHSEFLPNHSSGFFLASLGQGFDANPGGSWGNMCIAGSGVGPSSLGRFSAPGQVQNSGSGNSVSLLIDLTSFPQPLGSISVLTGEAWSFQYWHRDVISGGTTFQITTSNFTDALRVTFR